MSKHGISKTLEERSLIHTTKLNNTNRLRSSESTHELSRADLVRMGGASLYLGVRMYIHYYKGKATSLYNTCIFNTTSLII
jgi:hypothetical protein